MLEKICLRVTLELLTWPGWLCEMHIPLLDKTLEEQDWDMSIAHWQDWYDNTGASFFTYI